MNENIKCSLADGFSIWEKIYAQFSFIALGVIGTIGIILEDWLWIIPYILIYLYGIPGIIMRHINCTRCLHLFEYDDCLQAPVGITKRLVKMRKPAKFSTSERVWFYVIFLLIPIYPLPWLLSNIILLIAFLLMAIMWYGGQQLYFCKKCRVYDCPFNHVSYVH